MGKHLPEKKKINLSGISEIVKAPVDVTPETLEFLKGLIESFNESATELQEAYLALQNKFDKLNLQLEEANNELKQSLNEQERLSNYLTNILESLSSGVLVIDTEGLITLFNRGAENIIGVKFEDAVNKPYSEVMGTETPEELTPLWVLKENDGRSQMEKTILSKTGENIPVGFSISPLLNSSGELIGAVEIFMDLSGIKALEDELSRLDKLAALGQMSATMAHKIRNPLGGIVGYAGLINNNLQQSDKSKRQVNKIIEGVEKIEHIISSVLSYNSMLKLSPRNIFLSERIDEIIGILKQELEEIDSPLIGFAVSQPSESVEVEVDLEQLNIALRNIIWNAVESIEGEGNIDIRILPGQSLNSPSCTLSSELLRKMRKSSRMLKSRRPCCMILVIDSGSGMDENALKNLFVPFFTTKEKGIGLGLASARKIVDAHHGEIWLESTLNLGTAVGIILPSKSTVL